MYETYLDELARWRGTQGLRLPAPATLDQIADLRARVKARFGARLPPAYEEFLGRVNGLESHGLVVYGCGPGTDGALVVPGFVEANQDFRRDDHFHSILVFAESAQNLYVQDGEERRYQVLDRRTCGVQRSFAAWQGALGAALSAHRPGATS